MERRKGRVEGMCVRETHTETQTNRERQRGREAERDRERQRGGGGDKCCKKRNKALSCGR